MAKSGSKLFVSIIAFLLGFIFAILAEVGAIVGVYVYVTTQDIDTILAAVGLPNKDADGNNRYINTDPENGGAKTIKDLFESLKGLLYENGELSILTKSFDDFEQLIPATSMLLDFVYSTIGEYVDLDHELFESSPMTELAQVISDSVMNVHIGTLLEKLNSDMATNSNIIVKSLLLGAETEYASVVYATSAHSEGEETTGIRLPVMYDIYKYDVNEISTGWYRDPTNGNNAFHSNLSEDFIDETTVNDSQDGELIDRTGKLFYVPCRVTADAILPADYTIKYLEYDGNGKHYSFQYLDYAADTDFIAVKANAEGKYVLDHSKIWSTLNANSTGASDRFIGYSYYDEYGRDYFTIDWNDNTEKYELNTISGKNYFRDNNGKNVQLDALTLSDLIYDAFGPLYSVAVTEVVGDNAKVANDLFGKTTLGELLDGKVNFEKLINGMEMSSLISNVKPDNKIMAYIVFKLSDLKPTSTPDVYTAVYDKFGENEQKVIVMIDNGNINAVYDENDVLVPGVKVSEIASIADNMTINLLMDVRADNAIMSYIGYGITDLKKVPDADEESEYQYTAKVKVNGEETVCYVQTYQMNGKPVIGSVWYMDEEDNKVYVKSTKVTQVSDKVENLTADLTIGDVIQITDSSNQLLHSIRNTKINKLGEKIENLTVSELFTPEQIRSSAILRQLGNVSLNNLAAEIDNVLIQRIYANDIYGTDETDPHLVNSADEINESDLYYTVEVDTDAEGNEIYTYRLAGGNGHISKAQFEQGTYYTYGSAQKMWKLILYKNGAEEAYTVNNFGNMVNECTKNIYGASLRTLYEAGIITGIDESKLDGTISGYGKKIGEWSLQELISYVLDNLVS